MVKGFCATWRVLLSYSSHTLLKKACYIYWISFVCVCREMMAVTWHFWSILLRVMCGRKHRYSLSAQEVFSLHRSITRRRHLKLKQWVQEGWNNSHHFSSFFPPLKLSGIAKTKNMRSCPLSIWKIFRSDFSSNWKKNQTHFRCWILCLTF